MQAPISMSHMGTPHQVSVQECISSSGFVSSWCRAATQGDHGHTSPEVPLDHGRTEVLNLAKMAEFQGPEEPQALVGHRSL